MKIDVLPWHAEDWMRLDQQIVKGRLPHALLIDGPVMSGKSRIVDALVNRLLCDDAASPCGECHQCQLLNAGTHADLRIVTLEDSRQIVIDQIRDLIEWSSQTSQQGGWKVCVIDPADRLNIQSSNALLKSLEEPPARTSILLVTDQPQKLLPTLRSRCQRVECRQPGRAEAIQWLDERNSTSYPSELLLDIAGGVPLRALESLDEEFLALRLKLAETMTGVFTGRLSPVQFVAGMNKQDQGAILELMYRLIADSIGYTMSGGQVCGNTDLVEHVKALSDAVDLDERFALVDRINQARRISTGTTNANPQMLLEAVVMGQSISS